MYLYHWLKNYSLIITQFIINNFIGMKKLEILEIVHYRLFLLLKESIGMKEMLFYKTMLFVILLDSLKQKMTLKWYSSMVNNWYEPNWECFKFYTIRKKNLKRYLVEWYPKTVESSVFWFFFYRSYSMISSRTEKLNLVKSDLIRYESIVSYAYLLCIFIPSLVNFQLSTKN